MHPFLHFFGRRIHISSEIFKPQFPSNGDIIMRILSFLLVILTGVVVIHCMTLNANDASQDIFHENYGCSPGDHLIHLPNGPNCPCGYYAMHRHKKHINKLSPELRMPPYWSDGKLRYYICMNCAICDPHKPVLAKCSPYNNTACGSSCEEPYKDTNAGCFLLPSNSTSMYDATTVTEIPALTSHSVDSVTPKRRSHVSVVFPFEETHTCIKREIVVVCAGVLVAIFVLLLTLVVYILCKERWKRMLTICKRRKKERSINVQANTNNIAIDDSPSNERKHLAGKPEDL